MKRNVFFLVFIMFVVWFSVWGGVRVVKGYDFSINCSSYLKRASNANSIELAYENISKAIDYLEKNNLTHGQVSIFLKQPKNDIEYWFRNLKTAQIQLANVNENISDLEESNILMKLRETLTDDSDGSTSIVHPDGISIYPNNLFYFWWGILSFLGIIVFGFISLLMW